MSLQATIEAKVQAALRPIHLDVENESYRHNVPPGSESHFRLRIVTSDFESLTLVARHRLINDLLREELAGALHALALETLTPTEWQDRAETGTESPPCLGGDSDPKNLTK